MSYSKGLVNEMLFGSYARKHIQKMMKSRRKKLKISQRELAARCNLTHSTIVRLENSKATPRLDTYLAIMNELGLLKHNKVKIKLEP